MFLRQAALGETMLYIGFLPGASLFSIIFHEILQHVLLLGMFNIHQISSECHQSCISDESVNFCKSLDYHHVNL